MVAATTRGMSLYAMTAWAVLAFSVFTAPGALAQTSTSLEEITLTPAPDSTQTTSSPSSPTMTLQCWRLTTIAGQPASIVVDPKSASVSGAECWEVYPVGGGTASVPYSVTAPDFEPTADQTPSASATAESVSESGSSSHSRAIKVIMPAIIGSLVGFVLLAIATLWFLRLRMRRKTEASRARRWAERNSGSWQMKESSSQKAAPSDGGIEVGPRQPAAAPYSFSTRF